MIPLALLWDWLKGEHESIHGWLFSWLNPLVKKIGTFLKAMFAIGAFIWAALMSVYDLIDFNNAFESIASTFDSMTASIGQLPLAPIMGQLNRIFPLNEVLAMLSVVVGIHLVILAFKFVNWLLRLVFYLVSIVAKVFTKG